MSEDRHVAFDTELCAKNPEAAADRIAELESGLERLEAIEKVEKRLAQHDVLPRVLAYLEGSDPNSTSGGIRNSELRAAIRAASLPPRAGGEFSAKEELLESLQAVASILPKYEMKGDTASDDEALSAVLEMVTDAIAKATA
jgi:hypothetical protein